MQQPKYQCHARQQDPMTCVCLCPAGPRGFVPAAKLRPYSPVQAQDPVMQLLSLDSGTERRRHSYASPGAPRPQVATFTPTFQVRVGDIPRAISSSPTSSLLWVGRWICFSSCLLAGTRDEHCPWCVPTPSIHGTAVLPSQNCLSCHILSPWTPSSSFPSSFPAFHRWWLASPSQPGARMR